MDLRDAAFEALVAEGTAEPTEGWDFSWFTGRASEGRPSWGYAGLLSERMARARCALDIQTGGGEVLSQITDPPPRLIATEAWPPNRQKAATTLRAIGAYVVGADDNDSLPFADGTFDLVSGRHPVRTPWRDIARVLGRGGTFLSQQVGPGQARELIWFLMGPRPVGVQRAPSRLGAEASAAGLTVLELRQESLPMVFYDIGAVVYFLRKVLWTVPDFTVERYREQLVALHRQIVADGSFATHSERVLIEARRP